MSRLHLQPAMERDWKTDPFDMASIDGYLYGRGTSDNKVAAAHGSGLTLIERKPSVLQPMCQLLVRWNVPQRECCGYSCMIAAYS